MRQPRQYISERGRWPPNPVLATLLAIGLPISMTALAEADNVGNRERCGPY